MVSNLGHYLMELVLVAKIENRKSYSKKQVARALTNPQESLKYMAAVLKDAVDKFKEAGFDISDNIGVVTTLYNIGNIDERLKKTSKNKTLLPNYFGVFIKTVLRKVVFENYNPSKQARATLTVQTKL